MSAGHQFWGEQREWVPNATEIAFSGGTSVFSQPMPIPPKAVPSIPRREQHLGRLRSPSHVFLVDRTAQQVLPVVSTEMEVLEGLFVIEGADQVTDFLSGNKDVARLLISASSALDEAFGPACVKTLRILSDEEGYDTLYCAVSTRATLAEARRQLRDFDQNWWLSRAPKFIGRFTVDFDLV